MFKGWLPKHVVLQNKTLKYYNLSTKTGQIKPVSTPKAGTPKAGNGRNSFSSGEETRPEAMFGDECDGFINFASIEARVTIDRRCVTLHVKGATRTFVFKANTVEEAQAWYHEMKNHIR